MSTQWNQIISIQMFLRQRLLNFSHCKLRALSSRSRGLKIPPDSSLGQTNNEVRKNTGGWGYETIRIRNIDRLRRVLWSKQGQRKSQIQDHQIFVKSEILREWEDAESEALCQGLLRNVVPLADRVLHLVLRLDSAMLQEPAEHGHAPLNSCTLSSLLRSSLLSTV